jgi:N-acetylglutamate synthase-like GNAT family acetyltransferase
MWWVFTTANGEVTLPLVIGKARAEDAEALTDLCMRSKQSNGYDDAFMALCVDELRVTPEQIESTRFFVARRGDELLGCACLSPTQSPGIGEVEKFFVDPNAKRQGVGRHLWQHLLHEARAQGLTRLELSADPHAEPFYEALGFRTIGRTPSASIPGRTLPEMHLELAYTP